MSDRENIHLSQRTAVDPGPDHASGEVRSDAAGKTAGPPGGADLDRDALEKGTDRLGQAGAGH